MKPVVDFFGASNDAPYRLLEFVLKDKGKVSLYSVKPLSNKDAVLTNAYTDKNLSALNTATYSINDIQRIFKCGASNDAPYRLKQKIQEINNAHPEMTLEQQKEAMAIAFATWAADKKYPKTK